MWAKADAITIRIVSLNLSGGFPTRLSIDLL
jgi:hypothetical protein